MSAENTEQYTTSSAIAATAFVWSEEGLSTPDTLAVGDNIITSSGRLVPIKEIVDCGERSIYRVTLSNGMRSDSTYGRSLLVETKNGSIFKPVEDIKPGDRVVTVSDPKHPAGANATNTDVANGILTLDRETLKNVVALLLSSKTEDGKYRADVDINDENDVILTFEAANSETSSELQQILLGRFGVRSDRFRSILTITNEQVKLLANKIEFLDIILAHSSCPYSQEQFEAVLSILWYSTDRQFTSFNVTDVSGCGRAQTYGIVADGSNVVVDGMVSDLFRAR